jgi:hypothetical protein
MVRREGRKARGNGQERMKESLREWSGEEGKLEGKVRREGSKAKGNGQERRRES